MVDIFTDPLFTPREVATYLRIPQPTVYSWLRPVEKGPQLVHQIPPERRGAASVPFVALVEAYVLRALRDLRLTKRQIRNVVDDVREEFNTEYALATKKIATDGIDLFIEHVDGELSRAGDRQAPIREVITDYLRYITFDATGTEATGYASQLRLPKYGVAPVVIDPRFGWGVPIVEKSRVPVSAVIDLYSAGESMAVVADEYGLTVDDVEAICRAALAVA
jgi:uncharacterized protein (DUF433 family)